MPYKNARIHLRVTDEEKQSLIEKAAQARQSVSQYILSLSENKTIIVVDGADEVTRQLLKIGNNINQIAVVANTNRKNESELPNYYLKRITDYQNEIMKLLKSLLVAVTNAEIVGNVTLTKVDEDYPENKLTGAVFTVYKSDKKTVVGTMKEIETGVYSLEGLVYGEYYVQETKAPKYFVRDVNFYYFQIVNDGETVEVSNDELGKGTFINAPQKGEIKIVKTSYDKKVEGFHFEVTGKAYTGQEFKKTYTTDKNGIIRITDLRAGEYTIHEVKDTASAGYVLPGDVQLTIDRDGAVATAEMYNGNNPPSGVRNDGLQTVLIIISAVALSASAILISPRRKQHKH